MFDFFVGTCFITKLGFKLKWFVSVYYGTSWQYFFAAIFTSPFNFTSARSQTINHQKGFSESSKKMNWRIWIKEQRAWPIWLVPLVINEGCFPKLNGNSPWKLVVGRLHSFFGVSACLFSGDELLVLGKYPKLVMGRKWEQWWEGAIGVSEKSSREGGSDSELQPKGWLIDLEEYFLVQKSWRCFFVLTSWSVSSANFFMGTFPISVWFQKQNVKEKPRFYEDDECFFEKNVVVFVFFSQDPFCCC